MSYEWGRLVKIGILAMPQLMVGILNINLWAPKMFFKVVIPPERWKVKRKKLNRIKSSYLDLQWVPIDSKGFLLHTISEETNHHWLLVLVKRISRMSDTVGGSELPPQWGERCVHFLAGILFVFPHHSPPNHEMFATIRGLISKANSENTNTI